ncbi:MAG: GTP-binding protein, partial [Oscillospiraceae bacterium]|nr:GTP-binding protein [Oscillospiraceae bacterium]
EKLFVDSRYGRILRVKGFFQEGTQWYQLNATAQSMKTEKVPETRSAVIVIGISLNENEISLLLTGKTPEHRIL